MTTDRKRGNATASPAASTDRDGSPDDTTSAGKLAWLRAGQELLRSGGVSAVKIHGLRRQSGLTTGSFYHHFDGMSDYLEELAGFWGRDTPDHLREAQDPDPRLRLRKLASIVPREGLLNLDMAMRDWAGSDRAAAAAVERVDESLLGFVAEAFSDLGFDTAESQVRAHAWIAFGVARIRPPWPVDGEVLDRFIDLLCNPS